MTNESLLSQPVFQALGWALIHFIWQGALIALLYSSVRVVLRRSSANVRYAVACVGLLLMFALPIATTIVINRSLQHDTSTAQVKTSDSAINWKQDATRNAQTSALVNQPTWTATSATPGPASPSSPTFRQRFTMMLPWFVSIWLACVLILSLRVLGGWVKAQRLKSWNTSPAADRWQEMLTQLAARLNIARAVRLCESVVADVPTVIGWLRPVILVPVSAFVGLSAQQIEALLAHELAHIRRYDYIVNLLQTAIETLLFYHPAVWWISRQIRMEREHCCDDMAVALCGNVLTYARALAELEQLRGNAIMPQLAVAADGGGSLLKRIQRLIETPASRHQRSSAWLASMLTIATIFCICAGARSALLDDQQKQDETRFLSLSSIDGLQYLNNGRNPARISQTQYGEAAMGFRMAMPEIRASVNVISSLQDESPVAAPLLPTTRTNSALPVMAVGGNTATFQAMTSTMAAPVFSFSFSRETKPTFAPFVQEDENAPSTSYIEALELAGFTKLTVDQLIKMRDHGVTAGYVKELKALGYQLPSVDMVVRLVDHGVSIGLIKKLAVLGYKNPSYDLLVQAVDHGAHPDIIEALRAAGYDNLSIDQVIRAVDHGVGPGFIKAMAEVGFTKLSLDLLIRLRDHGVDPSFIKEIRSLGYDNVSPDQFIRMRDHGVGAGFLRKAKERGFNNLSLDELISLADADIL